MKINLKNAKKEQANLAFAPEFWEKPDTEIISKLDELVEHAYARIEILENLYFKGLL